MMIFIGINVLKSSASDEDLELYIMQLVQAIRFENDAISSLSELPRFLLDRSLASSDFRLLNFLYWSVVVAAKAEEESARYSFFLTKIEHESQENREDFYEEIQKQKWLIDELIELSVVIGNVKGRAEDKKKALRQALRDKGKFEHLQRFERPPIMPLRPEIRVSGIDPEKCTVFKSAMCPFLLSFRIQREDDGKEGKIIKERAISAASEASDDDNDEEKAGKNNTKPQKKINKNSLNDKNKRTQLIDLEKDEFYKIIWKNGDDLRQDQLIIQMINLMDNLLHEVNLDLCLTPYPVLATGIDNGMLEFVPNSTAIAGILKKYDDNISKFLAAGDGKQYKLDKVVDTFVRSCAGYCVITFLLGMFCCIHE